jgi:hypothetical protein
MRFMKWAVAVAAVSSLMGCGNSQPSVYRVALARVGTLPTSCYRTAPTGTPNTTTNLVDEKQWVIWEGLDDKMYLETGSINYQLGDAERILITGDAIEGGKDDSKQTVFTSVHTETQSATEVYTTSATYTFEELGKTLKGNLALHSNCAGANCAGTPTCDTTLDFSGRQINADSSILYDNNSQG